MDKLAIVGVFYDGYEDLWYDFINLFKLNWSDCPYKFYIVDNTLNLNPNKCDCKGITVLHAGEDAEYSKKLRCAVEHIEAEYYLLLLEDFYFVQKNHSDILKSIIDHIQKEKTEYFTMPMPEFIDTKEKSKVVDLNNTFRISTTREYLFSCQPSIWKREFLDFCIGNENYNAWVFEGIYSKNDYLRNEHFLLKAEVNYSNILGLRHGAVQGKMLSPTIKAAKKCGYTFKNTRDVLSYSAFLTYQLKRVGHRILMAFHLTSLKEKIRGNSILNKYNDQISYFSNLVIPKDKMDSYIAGREENA